jgi:opacity protein-like surface antigen
MKKAILAMAVLALGISASAAETAGTTTGGMLTGMKWTGTVGITQTSTEAKNCTACTSKSIMNIQAGATTEIPVLTEGFAVKTGGMFATRNGRVETNGSNFDTSMQYLDVPVYASYKFNEMFAAYGGLNLGVKLGSSCTIAGATCNFDKTQSLITPFVAGATATIQNDWTVGAFYETNTKYATFMSGTTETDISGSSAGITAGYSF